MSSSSAANSSSSGPLLASVSKASVKLWTWNETAKEFSLVGNQVCNGSTYKSVAWNHSNQVLIVDDEQQAKVFLLVVTNGQLYPPQSLSDNQPAKSSNHLGCIAISNNSRYLAVARGISIQLWDMKRKNVKMVFEGHTAPLVVLQFTTTGDLYSADETGAINLWSTKSVNPIHEISESVDGTSLKLTCMQLAPSNNLMVAGYSDGTVRVWDIIEGKSQQTQEQKLHNGAVKGLSCSPRNNKLVATIGEDEKLLLFDTSAKKAKDVVASIHVKKTLTTVAFHENGMQASVGTEDGMLLMYDWRNVKTPVYSMVAHDGHPVHALAYQMAKVSSSRTTESASSYTPSTTSSMTPKSSVDPSSGVKQSNNNSAANVQQVNPTSPDKIQQPVALSSSMRDMTPTKVVGSNGIKYEVSPMLEKKQHLHEKGPTSESGSVGGNTHISTFSPTPVPKPSSTFSSLRDTSDITQRVNNLITDYENSLKATATTTITESPRVSKNRYASATSLSNEFESTHTSNKPYIEPTKAADTNESFASQYSQRVKDTMEVGGYQKQNFTMAPPPQPAKQTYQQSTIDKLNLSRDSVILRKADAHAEDEFADLRQAVKPVTSVELEEALELLKYDIHREVQDVIREQVRQFAMAKEDTTNLIRDLSNQLAELLQANRELREENERLRKIY